MSQASQHISPEHNGTHSIYARSLTYILKYIIELHIAPNHITTYLSKTQECQLNLCEIYSNMNMSNTKLKYLPFM